MKKSQATAAWECRNSVQVVSERFGDGSMLLSVRILPHGCFGDGVAEAGEFAVDAAVSPCWVLGGEPQDQLA